MSPHLAFILIFKVYPKVARVVTVLVSTYALISTYYAWAERFFTKPGRRAARIGSLATDLPLALVFAVSALAFWFPPYKEPRSILSFERLVSFSSAVVAILSLIQIGIFVADPNRVKRPVCPRIRTRSRASLGY